MSSKSRFFSRTEWLGFWITAAVSFAVYFFTLAPNVGLEDSGEFLTASYNFGVPHPPGYPSWTILAYLFEHLPYGNAAWRVNLMSAVFGALSTGILSLITSKICGGIYQIERFKKLHEFGLSAERLALMAGVTSGLIFAFIDTMWSQAVITEVYTLNSLFFTTLSLLGLRWFNAPNQKRWPILIAFIFGLGITNHQTLLVTAPAFLFVMRCANAELYRRISVLAAIACGIMTWQTGLYYFLGPFCVYYLADFIYLTVRSKEAFTLGSIVSFIFSLMCGAAVLGVLSEGMAFEQWKNPGFWIEPRGLWLTLMAALFLIWFVFLVIDVLAEKRMKPPMVGIILGVMVIAEVLVFVMIDDVKIEALAALLVAFFSLLILMVNADRLTSLFGVSFFIFTLGACFYGYMWVASITNPPMNWGHVQSWEEFNHQLTRGQYERLSLFPRYGVEYHSDSGIEHFFDNFYALIKQYGAFVQDLADNFSFPLIILGLLPFLYFLEFPKMERRYFLFSYLCFFLLGLMLVFLLNPKLDEQSIFINRVFYSLAHGVYSMWIGMGAVFLVMLLLQFKWREVVFSFSLLCCLLAAAVFYFCIYIKAQPKLPSFVGAWSYAVPEEVRPYLWLAGASAFIVFMVIALKDFKSARYVQVLIFGLPLVPLTMNWADSEMRGHDFGWRYGHDMLINLDRDAVVYGGTDPGRFVPTYMIFVDSFQPRQWKVDPNFDRRDLYIITQNALADQTYMNYIRDHYDTTRPKMEDWYYRIFNRKETYPPEPLQLPSKDEFEVLFSQVIQSNMGAPWIKSERDERGIVRSATVQGIEGVFAINGAVAQWIFERNKARHAFYVEESYPLNWMYPYLEPCGLIMKINRDPIKGIDPKLVRQNRVQWKKITAELLYDPAFQRDSVAQKSYSKLRSSQAGLYAYRGMYVEAEEAFLQALDLAPGSAEARSRLLEIYMNMDRFDDGLKICAEWESLDPKNPVIKDATNRVRYLKNLAAKEKDMAEIYEQSKHDPGFVFDYINVLKERNKWAQVDSAVNELLSRKELDLTWWQTAVQFYANANKPAQVEQILSSLTKRDPKNAMFWYNLAMVQASRSEVTQACTSIKQAVKLDPSMKERFNAEPSMATLRETELYNKSIQ